MALMCKLLGDKYATIEIHFTGTTVNTIKGTYYLSNNPIKLLRKQRNVQFALRKKVTTLVHLLDLKRLFY